MINVACDHGGEQPQEGAQMLLNPMEVPEN